MRETNPIPAAAGWDGATGARADRAKRTQFPPRQVAGAGRSCKTKPISSVGGLAAQGPIVRNEPNSRRGRAGRGLGDAGRGAVAPNKANFTHVSENGRGPASPESPSRADRAKRSQFAPHRRNRPELAGAEVWRAPIAPNKPNPPRPAVAPSAWQERDYDGCDPKKSVGETKPISPHRQEEAQAGARGIDLAAARQSCRTKPIWGGVSNLNCQVSSEDRSKRAKQSQCGRWPVVGETGVGGQLRPAASGLLSSGVPTVAGTRRNGYSGAPDGRIGDPGD
jgi:hypothetical protein